MVARFRGMMGELKFQQCFISHGDHFILRFSHLNWIDAFKTALNPGYHVLNYWPLLGGWGPQFQLTAYIRTNRRFVFNIHMVMIKQIRLRRSPIPDGPL